MKYGKKIQSSYKLQSYNTEYRYIIMHNLYIIWIVSKMDHYFLPKFRSWCHSFPETAETSVSCTGTSQRLQTCRDLQEGFAGKGGFSIESVAHTTRNTKNKSFIEVPVGSVGLRESKAHAYQIIDFLNYITQWVLNYKLGQLSCVFFDGKARIHAWRDGPTKYRFTCDFDSGLP